MSSPSFTDEIEVNRLNRRVNIILWITCAAWLVLLSMLSSEEGFATARTSGRFTAFVMGLFRIPFAYQAHIESVLRILAHFALFFVLGALLYSAMCVTWFKAENNHIWSFGICGVLGILDEVKKVFIAGRHLSWLEAGLNVVGAWCGIIAAMLAMYFI